MDENYESNGHTESLLRLGGKKKLFSASQVGHGIVLPPEPLFDNFLLSKTFTLISAETGAGKTWLLLEMLLCLELGEPLLGKFSPRGGPHRCLFIGMDSSAWDVAKQFVKLCRGRGLDRDRISHFASDFILRGGERILMTDPRFLNWFEEWHNATKCNVLMLDTWRAVHGANENDSTAMEAVTEIARTIRDRFGVAVIATHHTRKSQAGFEDDGNDAARGSNTITGALDFHIRLQRRHNKVLLTMPKGREDFEGWEDITYHREMVDCAAGPGCRFVVETPLETYAPLLDALVSIHNRAGLIENAKIILDLPLEKAAKYVDNGLRKLKQEGYVENVGKGAWKLTK